AAGSTFWGHRTAVAETHPARRPAQGGLQCPERGGAAPSGGGMRVMRSNRELSSSPCPQTGGPEPTRPERKTVLGQADGSAPPQDAGGLPRVPRGHSSRPAKAARVQERGHWRAAVRSKDSCRVRGGAARKVPRGNSLAAYSTARPVREGAVGFPWSQGAGRLPHR